MILVALFAAAPPIVAEMHTRFADATAMRDGVIRGDLAAVRTNAKAVVSRATPEGMPANYQPMLLTMAEEARRVSEATDLASAAAGTARVAARCAECHEASQGGPGLEGLREVPIQDWRSEPAPTRHKWAADWLWLGLVAPDEEAWQRGVSELGAIPSPATTAIAARAAAANDAVTRTAVYGDLLATCTGCHARTPPRPEEP